VQSNQETNRTAPVNGNERSNLETCLKVLAGVQDQIRFADAKAAFVFGINALLFGFLEAIR
jgi:hypothetical protein